MSEPFVGEIRMFAGNFAPRGWAFCDGQLLAVSQNDALFSLFGTIYGGDGRTTFGLPDLRGRVPVHQGTGPGLSPRQLGARGGAEDVTLTVNQLSSHTHRARASDAVATDRRPLPSGTVSERRLLATALTDVYTDVIDPESFHQDAVTKVGGSQDHTNLQPFLCVNFIVALFGVYPSQN